MQSSNTNYTGNTNDTDITEVTSVVIEQQRALVNRWIAAFNGHDVAAIVALYAEDADLFDSGMKRVRHGRSEIERWFTSRFRTVPTITYSPKSQLVTGGQVVVTWTTSGGAPRLFLLNLLGRSFQVDGVSVFTLRDDLIQSQRGYYDHISVIEQLMPPVRWLVPRL